MKTIHVRDILSPVPSNGTAAIPPAGCVFFRALVVPVSKKVEEGSLHTDSVYIP